VGRLIAWLRHGPEAVVAAMLGAMFLTFLLQIFSRYVMVQPFGWTLELCIVLWVWIVFFGCAFVVRGRDHVTFDILYLAVPDRIRRIFAAISCSVVAVTFAWSVLPTWDWIDFLKIKRSATLQVPMRTIYAVYALFLVVVALRYAWRLLVILRGGAPREDHEIHVGEEG
jgi:TRAP-type C4-dicarboxylate transport system permease small subunit